MCCILPDSRPPGLRPQRMNARAGPNLSTKVSSYPATTVQRLAARACHGSVVFCRDGNASDTRIFASAIFGRDAQIQSQWGVPQEGNDVGCGNFRPLMFVLRGGGVETMRKRQVLLKGTQNWSGIPRESPAFGHFYRAERAGTEEQQVSPAARTFRFLPVQIRII